MKIVVCQLQRGLTGIRKLLSSLVTSLRAQEIEFQGLLFSEGFIREASLQEDLLFVSRYLMKTREPYNHCANIIDIGAGIKGKPYFSPIS